MRNKILRFPGVFLLLTIGLASQLSASEADIKIPDLSTVKFAGLGGASGHTLMMLGILVCAVGTLFGVWQYLQTKSLPVHESMAKVSHSIYETCKTYLLTQGKLLAILWVLIAACMIVYFGFLQHNTMGHVLVILLASILGILGSYGVAWFQSHQYHLQLPHGLLRSQGQPLRHALHSPALRDEHRSAARRGGIILHDLHPDVSAVGTHWPLLHRFRHW